MKKIVIILFLLVSNLLVGQNTAIPDSNFEQMLINLGYDSGTPNGLVPTANIDTITYLNVYSSNISDLTGIEDFTTLKWLRCQANQLTTIKCKLFAFTKKHTLGPTLW